MAINMKAAIGLGLLGVAGVAVAYSGFRGLRKTAKSDNFVDKYENAIHAHNVVYAQDYKVSMDQYMNRFGHLFNYIHAEFADTELKETYDVLHSQFCMMTDDDITLLLAGALIRHHHPVEYKELFPVQPFVFNVFQTRFISIHNQNTLSTDVLVPSFEPEELITMASEMRAIMKANKTDSDLVLKIRNTRDTLQQLLNEHEVKAA